VRDAVRTVRPYGVDTASGVEVNGVKEKYRLRAFIINAKECG